MLHPTVFNTSEICHTFGVRHAVMSPGSRNAPLIISFARNDKIKKWIILDERSAGFIALGIAQKEKEPVVLCCTSGTALLNYAPAIAEAFYREIPLIVLSADRPPELIDQRDGQTIRQFEVLKNHVRYSTQLPVIKNDDDSGVYKKMLIKGLQTAHALPLGPVHINIPFQEPFYPSMDQELRFNNYSIPVKRPVLEKVEFPKQSFSKILILVGQQPFDKELSQELGKFQGDIPILISPLNNLEIDGIRHCDVFIQDQSDLRPDLLITTGLSVLSKRLKNYLRNHKPTEHWHFDPAGIEVDTFHTNPQIIKSPLADFLKELETDYLDENYLSTWKNLEVMTENVLTAVPKTRFSEAAVFQLIFNSLPLDIDLHLSNSMPVRFAEIFGIENGIETWANRGTSGIDGVTSTALGTSLVSTKLNVLLTGDLAFLYDRNAFFHNHDFSNLRIIVSNNSGGGIFRLIDGASGLPELEDYFETKHNRTAEYICRENDIEYKTAKNKNDLLKELDDFFDKSDSPKLLEIFTSPSLNQKDYKELIS